VNLIAVGLYLDRFEAEHACNVLATEEIDAVIEADDGGGVRPELLMVKGVKVLVAEQDSERARGILNPETKETPLEPAEEASTEAQGFLTRLRRWFGGS